MNLEPIHPGETLLEDFLKPLGISTNQLSVELAIPLDQIHAIVNGQCAITADTATRLSMYFGVSPETWLRLQQNYDQRAAANPA